MQKECLEIREKFYKENADRWTAYYAGILKHIGVTYRHMNNLDRAIEFMEKGIKLRKAVYDMSPERWSKYYSSALASLAKTYRRAKKLNKAIHTGNQSLQMRKKQYLKNNDSGVTKYILSLETMAKIYIDLNEISQAHKYALESYELRKKYYEQKRTDKWKKYYASGLLTLAQSINNKKQSIALMQESVKFRQELYEKQGDIRKKFYIHGLEELANFYEQEDMQKEKEEINLKLKGLV